MTRLLLAILLSLAAPATLASASCGKLGQQAWPPLKLEEGTACFVLESITDEQGRSLDGEGPQIVVYFAKPGNPPVIAGELPYFATTGRIEDAFVMDIDQDGQSDIIVIHSAQVRSETDFQGPFYSVLVFARSTGTLALNERVSHWFGSGGDMPKTSDEASAYEFPYKTRTSVKAATASTLFRLTSSHCPLTGTIAAKTFLHQSPVPQGITNKYLVEGDKVDIRDATAGWCKAIYDGGKKPLHMWLRCSAVDLQTELQE